MTVGKGVVYAYEAHQVKYRVALVRVPFYFINLWLTVTDSHFVHIYATYIYIYIYVYIYTFI